MARVLQYEVYYKHSLIRNFLSIGPNAYFRQICFYVTCTLSNDELVGVIAPGYQF